MGSVIKAKRDAKASGSYYVDAQPKLVFVVRIKGIMKIPPKPRKVMQLLRLTQINSGVFVRLTKATSELIKLAEPYIAYGYPPLSTIRQLVTREVTVRSTSKELHCLTMPSSKPTWVSTI